MEGHSFYVNRKPSTLSAGSSIAGTGAHLKRHANEYFHAIRECVFSRFNIGEYLANSDRQKTKRCPMLRELIRLLDRPVDGKCVPICVKQNQGARRYSAGDIDLTNRW